MKKLIEYMTIALSVGGTLCLVAAAGAIDGGYKVWCIYIVRNNYVYIIFVFARNV